MKIPQICVFALLVIATSLAAFGDTVTDPKIIIHGVSGAAPFGEGCQFTCVGMNFSFGVPESGSGTLFFTNNSGKNWTSLALFEKGVAASAISCNGSNLFKSCTTKTLANGTVEILLSGVKGHEDNPQRGILNGQGFYIKFACVGNSCWPGGLDFTARANIGVVPEPGSVALMITGLSAIAARRKVWKNRFNA